MSTLKKTCCSLIMIRPSVSFKHNLLLHTDKNSHDAFKLVTYRAVLQNKLHAMYTLKITGLNQASPSEKRR